MAGDLQGKCILVVEDDYFIASDLKRALGDEGAVILGPVGYLDEGLLLAETEGLQLAVLDINLGDITTFPIADRLAARRVPCLFVTGYDGWSLPPAYRDAPRINKPFTTRAVVDGLGRLATGDGA